MSEYLADVSEFQRVDWDAYANAGYQAAVARTSYGYAHDDHQWAYNLAGMRRRLRVRHFYQFLVAGEDATAQAKRHCDLIGQLLPGEFVWLDLEEGSGDQSGRAAAWFAYVDGRFGRGRSGLYSGYYFARDHLGGWPPPCAHGRPLWLANYQGALPGFGFDLWQCSDGVYGRVQNFAGIGKCDASYWPGAIYTLAALGGSPAPVSTGTAPASAPPAHHPKGDDDMILLHPGDYAPIGLSDAPATMAIGNDFAPTLVRIAFGKPGAWQFVYGKPGTIGTDPFVVVVPAGGGSIYWPGGLGCTLSVQLLTPDEAKAKGLDPAQCSGLPITAGVYVR